ncbi:MAG: restriction endonuclease subunit S [Balneolaceae bacterium]|nr:restriction endonuclease subunit S [Balneolaceae bacterium]
MSEQANQRAIKSVCQTITSGGTPSRKKQSYYSDDSEGYLWIKSKELLDNSISDTEEYITEKGLDNSSAKLFPKETVLVAMYGANVGQLGWLKKKATTNQAICGLQVDKEKADFRYLFYALLAKRDGLIGKAHGAAQQNLNQSLVKNFELPFPSLSTQKKIASILSAFDDLIENNTRRIEILEEMARRIYREWFVHFRYPYAQGHRHTKASAKERSGKQANPGHEDDGLVDSGTELGEIPKGWEVKEFGELVEYERDRVKNEEVEERVSVLGLGDMLKESINLSEWENTDDIGSTKLRFKKDDILFGKIRPYFHKVGFAQTSGVCSSDIFVWRPKEYKDFVLALLAASSDKFVETATNSSSGTKMPRAKWDVLEKYLVAYPPDNLLKKLNSLIGSSLNQIRTLSFQNKRLKETRDLLLPKLISGRLVWRKWS